MLQHLLRVTKIIASRHAYFLTKLTFLTGYLLFCDQDDSVSQSSSDAGLGSDHESDTLTIGEAWKKSMVFSPCDNIVLSLTFNNSLNFVQLL